MARSTWKARERDVAAATRGRRYPANTGGPVDVETASTVIQVKERRTYSLAKLEALALEIARVGAQMSPPKLGEVWIKRSAGRGVETPWLVVCTRTVWEERNGKAPIERNDADGR